MQDSATKILYVTRDIERALGLMPSENYQILTNRTPYSETIKREYPDFVHLIDTPNDPRITSTDSLHTHSILNTAQLLESDETASIIAKTKASLLVFKNNTMIEAIVRRNGWNLLNPPCELSEKIENKITQIEWLGELGTKYLPPNTIAPAKSLKWNKEPIIIQWEHGHTGDGTLLVNSQIELEAIQNKFPNRIARSTSFINGPSFTVNVIVGKIDIYVGNISYQITGLPPFTDNPFSTIGNDWSLPHSLLTDTEITQIDEMAQEIGRRMSIDGWSGLFGLDFIKDDERNKIFLIEINARQPASTTFESFLQEENRRNGVVGVTVFEAHHAAMRREKIQTQIIPTNDGAQIVQRITKNMIGVNDDTIGTLELAGYRLIPYSNSEYNEDILRIQCRKGIMESHGKFNTRGKEIVDTVSAPPEKSVIPKP